MNNKEVLNQLRKYQSPNDVKSLKIYLVTLLFPIVSVGVGIFAFDKYPIISVLTLPVSFIYLCRSLIIIHDTGHNSLFSSTKMNIITGNIIGFTSMMPFYFWRYIHSLHHGTLGQLDTRKRNPELMTWTTKEYDESSFINKMIYGLARSAFTQIVIVPIVLFLVTKIPISKGSWKANVSVLIHDVLYATIVYFSLQYGLLTELLLFYLLPLVLVHSYASMVFYLQHQFDGTHWMRKDDWNIYDAAVEGSSFLKFNKAFDWLTGSIGFHHIHHLNSRIPFYNLSKAHKELGPKMNFKVVYFKDFFKHTKLKLWDENKESLVPFRHQSRR